MSQRTAEVRRSTAETDVRVALTLDGTGQAENHTGVPFLDHMLDQITRHGSFDLTVAASGDLEIDAHHTVEDVGITLGQAFKQAVGDKQGIRRYGHAYVPLDEALSRVVVDFSGRPYLVYELPGTIETAGGFNVSLAREFFRAVANSAGLNLHIHVKYGQNDHHVTESVFKSFGRALDQATALDRRIAEVASSKGKL